MELVIVVGLILMAIGLCMFWWLLAHRTVPAQAKKTRVTMESLNTVAAWPPQPTRVLTNAERLGYLSLKNALPDHIILAQVPLSRFIKVPTRKPYSEWLRRVGFMSVDLLICDFESQVIGAVEIRSQPTQETARAHKRHKRMENVLTAADIPLHIWFEGAIPSALTVRELILGKVKTPEKRITAVETETQPPYTSLEGPETLAEHREPPPSTWFHDLDTDAMPLNSLPKPESKSPTPMRAEAIKLSAGADKNAS
jgi:hypothetical protein